MIDLPEGDTSARRYDMKHPLPASQSLAILELPLPGGQFIPVCPTNIGLPNAVWWNVQEVVPPQSGGLGFYPQDKFFKFLMPFCVF